jgi:hypothetical protein
LLHQRRRAFFPATCREESSPWQIRHSAERVIDARGAADFSGGRSDGIDFASENELLDLLFHLIVELVAIVPEKFNAVIFVRIMEAERMMPASARAIG